MDEKKVPLNEEDLNNVVGGTSNKIGDASTEIPEQFSGLHMESLIGSPLAASKGKKIVSLNEED
ncbi:hypothetical protein LJB81_01755 [Desulfovibrio sp. OttesenSCG-928-M14]|nr:hypothetical protein [Desulfovibrio sp. OttesenSCG-928-M14]